MRHHDALHKIRHAKDQGLRQLDLSSMGLEYLPEALAELTELEHLDLSGNHLASLPAFMAKLKGLKRLFLTKNRFEAWPAVIAELPSLSMFSLKSNRLSALPGGSALPASLVWLILTDNRIEALPEDFGLRLGGLRKLALAGNRLASLPASFAALGRLELLRLGNNRLASRPAVLRGLPRLSWLGLGGNPWQAALPARQAALEALEAWRFDPEILSVGEILGSGASGTVHRARLALGKVLPHGGRQDPELALKVFKPVSSDGSPEDELAVAAQAAAWGEAPPGVIAFRGWTRLPGPAMALEFLPHASPLGLVPSYASVTRDTYPPGFSLPSQELPAMVARLARSQAHLLRHGIIHGDFYAHNILRDAAGQLHLGDWGASFFRGEDDGWMEACELRAFGCLLEELIAACPDAPGELRELGAACRHEDPTRRPGFGAIVEQCGAWR